MGLISRFKKNQAVVVRSQESADDLVRAVASNAFPAGGEWQVALARRSATPTVLPAFIADFVASCRDFKTLPEHLDRYASYHGLEAAQENELRGWLPQLRAGGMFVSTSELRKKILAGSKKETAPKLSAIGFPTGNRPTMMTRAVRSFAENARRHGRDLDFVIADNSLPETRGASRAAFAELSRELGLRAFFAGEEEKRVFAAQLGAEAGCDPAILEFALFDPLQCGFACGANRNALMLHAAGEAFSSVDDDMICRIAKPAGCDEGLTFFSTRDQFERWFYESHEAAREAATFAEQDYAGLHEEMLGKSVADCVAKTAESTFASCSDELLRRLEKGGARIAATFTGHCGDPGIPSAYYYLTYSDATFSRLTQSEAFYRKVLSSRAVFAAVRRPSIGDASLSPGLAMGLDGRELLPPFMPVLHAEDFIFGATLWQCRAHAVVGHVPFALIHDPGKKPITAPGDLNMENRATIWEFAHLLRGLVLEHPAPSGERSTAVRMRVLGRHLREFGAAPPDDFAAEMRLRVLQHESEKIGYLEHRLRTAEEAPDFWRADVEAYLEHTRAALTFDDFDIPFDLKKTEDAHEVGKLMRRLVFEFGRLLEAWPDLFEAAKNLRARGCNLAKRPRA